MSVMTRTEGARSLFKAYGATVGSFGPFSAIYLMSHEQIKQRFATYHSLFFCVGHMFLFCWLVETVWSREVQKKLSRIIGFFGRSETTPNDLPATAFFLSGGMAGAIAAFITNPLDLVKLRMQVSRCMCIFVLRSLSEWGVLGRSGGRWVWILGTETLSKEFMRCFGTKDSGRCLVVLLHELHFMHRTRPFQLRCMRFVPDLWRNGSVRKNEIRLFERLVVFYHQGSEVILGGFEYDMRDVFRHRCEIKIE